jgi:hypothetical protein
LHVNTDYNKKGGDVARNERYEPKVYPQETLVAASRDIISRLGGPSKTAILVGTSPSYIIRMVGNGLMPVNIQMILMDLAAAGEIDVRPNDFWAPRGDPARKKLRK